MIQKLQALAKGTAGNSTGADVAESVNALIDKINNIEQISARISSVAAAKVLAISGDIKKDQFFSTASYHENQKRGGSLYQLKDAETASSRPTEDGGSIIHVGSDGLYFSAIFFNEISLSQFGASMNATNSPTIYENATSLANSGQVPLIIDGEYDFGGASANQSLPCTVKGEGVLNNIRIIVDFARDDSAKPKFAEFTLRSDDRSSAIVLRAARFLEIDSVLFWDLDDPITGDGEVNEIFHNIGLINIHDCSFIGCTDIIYFPAENHSIRPYNDLKFTNNIVWFAKRYVIYADQLDGLTYSNNLTHFDKGEPQSKNHIHIKNGEQVVIGGGNTYFNGGEETVYCEDVTSIQISGTQRLWHPGQNKPASGYKFVNQQTKFLNLMIGEGSHFEKPSLHMVEVEANNGLVKIGHLSGVIDVNTRYHETDNPGGFYFGAENLDEIDHYGIYSPYNAQVITCQDTLKFINVTNALINLQNHIARFNETQEYRANRAISGRTSGQRTFSINALQTLCRVFNSEGGNGYGAGELLINVYSSTGKSATYKFLVSNDTSGGSLSLIGSAGHVDGVASDDPSFQFGIYPASGDLFVSRIGEVVNGEFDFHVFGFGDVYPRFLF